MTLMCETSCHIATTQPKYQRSTSALNQFMLTSLRVTLTLSARANSPARSSFPIMSINSTQIPIASPQAVGSTFQWLVSLKRRLFFKTGRFAPRFLLSSSLLSRFFASATLSLCAGLQTSVSLISKAGTLLKILL
jgi:hypothetical protein